MLAQFIVNKLTGVAVCAAAIAFYFGGTMELTNCLLMLLCSFILFEQLDSAGSFSALFRSIDIGVDKANTILRVDPMDIDGEELTPEREDIVLSHVNFSYDSKPMLFCYGMLGSPLAIWVYKDSFLTQIQQNGMSAEYVESLSGLISVPMLIALCISPIVGGAIGALISKGLFRKHFRKAGIV